MSDTPTWYIRERKHLKIKRTIMIIALTTYIVLFIVGMVQRLFPIWLGVYCISYPIIVTILYEFWGVSLFGLKRLTKIKRKRYFKIHDEYGFLETIKDPRERQFWINFYRKRITLTILMLLFPVVPVIYLIMITGSIALIGILVFIGFIIIWQLYRFADILWVNNREDAIIQE